jgi:hypothetical protein
MDATSWALIIALHIHPQPSDPGWPAWIHKVDQVWMKVGLGGLPSERICEQAIREILREMDREKAPQFELSSMHCEPYAHAEKISAPPSARKR